MSEIEKIIESFLRGSDYNNYLRSLGYKESTVENIFQQFQTNYMQASLDPGEVSYAIEETVRSYSRDKSTAIKIFARFI
jgi:hypothetical protein